jgi:hypothetical protein
MYSVFQGPTKVIVEQQPQVFDALSIAFPLPGEHNSAQLGLPDVLFFSLFLGATVEYALRTGLTWVLMTLSFGATLALAVAFEIGGLPALPLLSAAFVIANADLIWRELRRRPATERPELLDGVDSLVRLVGERPDASEQDLAEALARRNLSESDSWRIVGFAQLAFGRLLLASSGAVFSETYEIRDPDSGRRERGAISEEPAYEAATRYARAHAADETVIRIGERSAEVAIARQALPEGRPIDDVDMVFPDPLLLIPIGER